MTERRRPDRPEYYMRIAMAVRARANCIGNKVGAVLVRGDRIVSTGYNGTPQKMKNCDEGGCERCANRDRYPAGQAYDVCVCVHAEQNALLAAARFGIAVEDAAIYTTMKPCFGCAKQLLQAGVRGVYYLHEWEPDQEFAAQYEVLVQRFPEGLARIPTEDPDADWAVSRRDVHAGQPG